MNATELWIGMGELPTQNKCVAVTEYIRKKINETNSTQLPDSGLSVAQQFTWSNYRDDLREILSDVKDGTLLPDDVVFPTEPEVI